MPVIKKKKVSKKNKASWRKHVDIKDVEDFLEEKRLEERIGKISEKKDDQLFTIDTTQSQKSLTPKEKRKANARKPAKNCSILNNTSQVEDPLIQRNHVKQKKNGRNVLEEILNPTKSKRVLQANKDRITYYKKLDQSEQKKINFDRDIWEEEDVDKLDILKNEWIRKDAALHNLKSIGKPLVKTHDSIRHKTSLAKSFEPPHPGISYNPSLKDHQDLLNEVVEKESKIIKTEQHLKRVTIDMFEKVTAETRDLEKAMEMASGLPLVTEDDSEKSSNEDNIDAPYRAVNPPVLNKKKDKKAKRKQREQRLLRLEIEKKKEHKRKVTDIHRIKKIKEEIVQDEVKLNQLRKSRRTRQKQKKFEPKRISKLKYEEPEIDVNMMEDISGNLRNVKNEGSLLIERFKNFQKRNILPPSVDIGPHKRRKIKRFVRSSHKDVDLDKKDL